LEFAQVGTLEVSGSGVAGEKDDESSVRALSSGAIYIEFAGRANITAESGANAGLLRLIVETSRSKMRLTLTATLE
jgi:hypothetical protein